MRTLVPVSSPRCSECSQNNCTTLIQLNLIDGYWLFVNPIILGRGIPLFTDIDPDSYREKINLHLVTTRPFTCGVTEFQLHSGQKINNGQLTACMCIGSLLIYFTQSRQGAIPIAIGTQRFFLAS